MKQQIPTPLFRKILFSVIIGVGCLLVSTVYCMSGNDSILLYMGIAVFCFSLWKAWSVYRISVKQQFELLEGICTTISCKPIGKLQIVKITNADGVESTLRLLKNCRLKVGEKYRFYFSETNSALTGNNYLDTVLTTGSFLGYEALNEE